MPVDEPARGRTSKSYSYNPSATTTTLHTNNYSCIYCEGNHNPDECTKIVDVERRKQVIRASHRCFVCSKLVDFVEVVGDASIAMGGIIVAYVLK